MKERITLTIDYDPAETQGNTITKFLRIQLNEWLKRGAILDFDYRIDDIKHEEWIKEAIERREEEKRHEDH